jgi:hypothetical protein
MDYKFHACASAQAKNLRIKELAPPASAVRKTALAELTIRMA